jgi:predicted site-specific integrase-resolvase
VLEEIDDLIRKFGYWPSRSAVAGHGTKAHGTNIEVLNQAEMKSPQQELADDLITIISHFAGKIYGLRSHKHKEVVERAKNLFTQA